MKKVFTSFYFLLSRPRKHLKEKNQNKVLGKSFFNVMHLSLTIHLFFWALDNLKQN
jgi:hypothetical protein